MAVRVHVENDGPAITGELRIVGQSQISGGGVPSRYGIEVELATGARQDHVLYAQPTWFGTRLSVTLVDRVGNVVLTQPLAIKAIDPYVPVIVVVAERPEGITGDVRAGATSPMFSTPVIVTIGPEELPPRVEAWSAIDRLVWQDVDAGRLSTEQLSALQTWVTAGGRLIIVGGSTGTTGLGAFPPELLPFRPATTLDVDPADLAVLLGSLPADATSLPAVAGTLERGTVLGRSGDHVFAAQASVGQGMVTIMGIDPATPWLAETDAASSLWRRLLPPSYSGVLNPLVLQDDATVVSALSNLPTAALPDLGTLLVLLVVYVALIGPLNYFVLRRLDRRELAWITMPALVLVFAVAAYGIGVGLRGTDVIVNELGIVRGAAGSDRGVGQYYVGVFSPARGTYDVAVAQGALLTQPNYLAQQGQSPVPLDVLIGDPSRLRGFQVGFGVLRAFRAEAATSVPRVEATLTYRYGRLVGTVANRSDVPLESVAVVFGGGVANLGALTPGQSTSVDLDVAQPSAFGTQLSERLFGPYGSDGRVERATLSRRTVIDQLTYYSDTLGGYGSIQQGPVVLAWAQGASLPVDLGSSVRQVGETLYLLPAAASITGPSVFPNALIAHSVVDSRANEAMDQGPSLSLSRGTMSVEYRPMGLAGGFEVSGLSMALTQGDLRPLVAGGQEVKPLPPDQQPDQDDPVGDGAPVATGIGDDGGDGGVDFGKPVGFDPAVFDGIPDFQLFDRVAGRWVEFAHPHSGIAFRIADPERYVDDAGAFLVRFVNRGDQQMTAYFSLVARLEGIAA
jgi:hypothetical protein